MEVNESAAALGRGTGARIGICLLNLLQPGIGLLRLARYRAGFLLLLSGFAFTVAMLGFLAFGPPLDFTGFMALIGAALTVLIVVYGFAIVLSWRWSRQVEPRDGWIWRWYGLTAVWLAVTAASLLLPDSREYQGSFYLVSESTAPTLVAGDRVVVRMRDFGPVKRGDVVVHEHGGADYIHRVAALPGDAIAMVDGSVVLNGMLIERRQFEQTENEVASGELRLREQFPGEARPHIIRDSGPTAQDNMVEVRLGEGEYFLLGDNRDNSRDSRIDSGMAGPGIVSQNQIKGRVLFSYWRTGVGLANLPL